MKKHRRFLKIIENVLRLLSKRSNKRKFEVFEKNEIVLKIIENRESRYKTVKKYIFETKLDYFESTFY